MVMTRKTLSPDKQEAVQAATKEKTADNQHPLHCSSCLEMYYVDERAYHQFMHALEFDASDNTFVCDSCTEEEAEEEH